jgi:Domain of unknown function (DUF4194)
MTMATELDFSAGAATGASGSTNTSAGSSDLSALVVPLLKGVTYRADDAAHWHALLQLQGRVRDHVSVLGLELMLDEAEGYAFLRSRPDSAETEDAVDGKDAAAPKLPRLVARRPLSFGVSLLLALLRKKLAEFDASGSETRLILSREQVAQMLRVFMPEGSNQTRLVDQVDTQLNKAVDLGFLRRLRGQEPMYEVQRILKAFVDAQWLAELDARLAAYRAQLEVGAASGAASGSAHVSGLRDEE